MKTKQRKIPQGYRKKFPLEKIHENDLCNAIGNMPAPNLSGDGWLNVNVLRNDRPLVKDWPSLVIITPLSPKIKPSGTGVANTPEPVEGLDIHPSSSKVN